MKQGCNDNLVTTPAQTINMPITITPSERPLIFPCVQGNDKLSYPCTVEHKCRLDTKCHALNITGRCKDLITGFRILPVSSWLSQTPVEQCKARVNGLDWISDKDGFFSIKETTPKLSGLLKALFLNIRVDRIEDLERHAGWFKEQFDSYPFDSGFTLDVVKVDSFVIELPETHQESETISIEFTLADGSTVIRTFDTNVQVIYPHSDSIRALEFTLGISGELKLLIDGEIVSRFRVVADVPFTMETHDPDHKPTQSAVPVGIKACSFSNNTLHVVLPRRDVSLRVLVHGYTYFYPDI